MTNRIMGVGKDRGMGEKWDDGVGRNGGWVRNKMMKVGMGVKWVFQGIY